jgi:hypothetical protein
MEAIQPGQFTLKQILRQNWNSFLDVHLLKQDCKILFPDCTGLAIGKLRLVL